MWKRLDHLKNYRPVCPTDAASFKEYIESERIFKFLAGLNSEFDPVRSRVLGIEPLPSLRDAFAYVQNEESHRSAMLPSVSTDRSALASSSQGSGKGLGVNVRKDYSSKNFDATDKWCDHCNRAGHIHATCWELHGCPPSTRGRGGGRGGGRSGG